MSRVRLRVSHRDPALVVAQGSTKRSYLPFAQCFGANANRKAALIVRSINCSDLLIKTMQSIKNAAEMSADATGVQLRVRLALIGKHARAALVKLDK